MRILLFTVLGLMLCLASTSATAKNPGNHGRGNGGGGNELGVSHGQGHPAFSSSFPRGNAWGLRRNSGLPVARSAKHGRLTNPLENQTIRRAGHTWQWSTSNQSWTLLE